ncbi:MAG: hypothetical protein F4093_01850 [Gammaproteobacteria bacterium]|nr:hypothetical protein [Gammaproteobacteria bacterium]MYJ51410.1 hypothetical protein [Gammaproteobacteria bacterium]
MYELELFYKDDCDLCDRMREELARYFRIHGLENRVAVQLQDIESRTEWYDWYRDHVPVIVIGGEEICHYFLDEQALSEALGIQNGRGHESQSDE